MIHSSTSVTWCRRLGVCAALAVAAGCNGGESLSGAGGSRGATGLGAHAGGSQGSGASGAASGSGATGGGAIGGAGATGVAGADGGSSGAGGMGGTAVGGSSGGKLNTQVDILMMIDDSSEMTEMQEKLYNQLPSFIQALQNLAVPPSLHLAVVSSDMGAPVTRPARSAAPRAATRAPFRSRRAATV